MSSRRRNVAGLKRVAKGELILQREVHALDIWREILVLLTAQCQAHGSDLKLRRILHIDPSE